MIDFDKWQEIYHSLRKNKTRTIMTAFGVFWGIFMLIIMLGSGNGLENGVTDGMGDFATNSAFIWTQSTTMPYKGLPRGRRFDLTNEDMKAIKENIPEVALLAPRLEGWGADGNNVIRGTKSGAFTIHGDYPAINKIDPNVMSQGRFINEIDIQEARKVAVIGNKVYEILFEPGEDPIGEYIRIKGVYFQVVGVFTPASQAISFGGDKEKTIFLPFTSLQKAYNFGDQVHYFSVTAKPGIPASLVEEAAMALLARRHKVHPDDKQAFGHFNVEKQFNQMQGLFMGISSLIWVVGIGTLIAGVIGVSNIMLVIIRERTKEIGIQRALGAKPIKIINQIITESIVLTSFAGYFGLVAGVVIIELIDKMLQNSGGETGMFKNPEVDFQIAVTALLILVICGALAGMIPAKRAIKIKPIDALRAE